MKTIVNIKIIMNKNGFGPIKTIVNIELIWSDKIIMNTEKIMNAGWIFFNNIKYEQIWSDNIIQTIIMSTGWIRPDNIIQTSTISLPRYRQIRSDNIECELIWYESSDDFYLGYVHMVDWVRKNNHKYKNNHEHCGSKRTIINAGWIRFEKTIINIK